jgi:hypothetical protein
VGITATVAMLLLVVGVAGCGASSPPSRFDEHAAWSLVELQVAAGQRPAGSPQLRRLAVRLRDRMPGGRFESIPGQRGLRNVVARLPGRTPGIVVGAHYDTLVKPKGFVGANNGASGSAIVVELSRALSRARRPPDAREVTFVLFDGEDRRQGSRRTTRTSRATGCAGPARTCARTPAARRR